MPFTPDKSIRRFCSKRCSNNAPKNYNPPPKTGETLSCLQCQKAVYVPRNRVPMFKYCSRSCQAKGMGLPRMGIPLPKNPNRLKTPYKQLVRDGRHILEHRWVMQQHLGRRLLRHEHVHHINGNTRDNRLENLEVVDGPSHNRAHTTQKIAEVRRQRYAAPN